MFVVYWTMVELRKGSGKVAPEPVYWAAPGVAAGVGEAVGA
jgi:hypothetical protein